MLKESYLALQVKAKEKMTVGSLNRMTKDCLARVSPVFLAGDFEPSMFFKSFLKGQKKVSLIVDHVDSTVHRTARSGRHRPHLQ